ncbi:MAG: hypothetical protein WA434_07315 [Candidatus Acidiferrales bacterium]
MSAIAGPGWNAQNDGPLARLPHSPVLEESSIQEKLAAIRDTMIVLSMQLIFRAFTMLRRWKVTEF